MPCYTPLIAYRALTGRNPLTGKWPIVFNVKDGYQDMDVSVPCGKCIGCRLERSRQWAIRCVHESQLHSENCFLTLTYSNENLPENGSLNKRNFVLFMKKLRKKYGPKIRFFHCGEYGEQFQRPHHHVCLFGYMFKDKKLWKQINDVNLYTSEELTKLWGYGYCTIGEVTFESAAYVARYITKKITGKMADDHYKGRQPEYITMSRKPGIAHDWITKYISDVYPSDQVIIRGKPCKPAKYYDKIYDQTQPEKFKDLSIQRKIEAKKFAIDNTPERLITKLVCKKQQIKQLKRPYENE